MHRPVQSIAVLMFLALLFGFTGCGDDSAENPTADAEGEAKAGETSEPGNQAGTENPGHENHNHGETEIDEDVPGPPNIKPLVMARTPERDSIGGRWLLRFVQIIESEDEQQAPPQIGERPVLLISINPGDGENKGSIVPLAGLEQPFVDPQLIDVKAVGREVAFTATDRNGNRTFDFIGTFRNGVVIGSLGYEQGAVVPARLIPTDEKTLARIPSFAPFPAMPEFIRLQQQSLIPEQTLQFAKDHPTSPLCRMAFLSLVQSNLGANRSVEDVESAIQATLEEQTAWGDRSVRQTRYQILQFLNQTGYRPEFSLKYLDELEKLPPLETGGVEVKYPELAPIRQQVAFRRAYEELQSSDEEVQKKGRAHCEELLKEMPYNVFVLLALADSYRLAGDVERAIDLYAEIKALPMQELLLMNAFASDPVKRILPSQRLKDLWKKSKRTGTLDEYVDSIYESRLLAFAGEPVTSRPDSAGNRVVLAELFTSSNSPESVAGDLVVSALEKTYPHTMFISLRYHQHSHAPDPLANQDGEARVYNFYRFPGAPLLVLNGEHAGTISGAMNQTSDLHDRLRKRIDEMLTEESEVTIALTANRQGDSIQVQAQVDGADLTSDNLRLRIVLAESEIDYSGLNKIRRHDMVARTLIGGDDGIAAADGMLKYEGQIDLAAVRKELTDYLTEFEDNQDQKFPAKPVELQKLHVVAFVQDNLTREVLQSAVVSLNAPASE